MLAVAFDTLKLAKRLESGGMPAKQAQEMSASLSESFSEWLSVGNVATREDLLKVEAKLEAKIAEVRVEIQASKAEIMKWMLGQTVVLLAALFGLLHGK
jgi:hypothetical protein